MIMLSSVSSVYMVPAIAMAGYTMVTINNSFDSQIEPIVAALDSHGASLLLSVGLITFFMNYGYSNGFFMMLICFMGILPFFFDGAMSLISAHRGEVLSLNPNIREVIHDDESDEDEYQKVDEQQTTTRQG